MSTSSVRALAQSTLFINKSLRSVSLKLVLNLEKNHVKGTFNLVVDPLKARKACIIGMFVLRPARTPFAYGSENSIYGEHDWTYNVKGIDGGKLISDSSVVDAYRLALQYGLSDAVIVGSKLVTTDGAVTDTSTGYIWQPYEVCNWGHLKATEPSLMASISEQRKALQTLGYLSKREYPAQIVVTWSGEKKDPLHDFLGARIFHEPLPNGKPMEAYIVTSEVGARRIRQRARDFNLHHRIDDILITLPPPPASPLLQSPFATADTEIDIARLPTYLYERLNIRIANHDGGRDVLRAFARAGALSQLNLTLCRGKSVVDVLQDASYFEQNVLRRKDFTGAQLESKLQYFFNSAHGRVFNVLQTTCTERGHTDAGDYVHGVPRSLQVVDVTQALHDEVTMVTLKADFPFDF